MTFLPIIEQKLGRPLEASRRGSIDHLNDVPEDVVADARKLGTPMLAKTLIDYYTSSACFGSTGKFVQDVVFGSVSPRTWRRGRVLVPGGSLVDQLRIAPRTLLAPIGGESRLRVVPDLASWRVGTGWVGAPARRDPDSDYRSPPIDHVASLVPDAALEEVSDPQVAFRRWIAGRLAGCLRAWGRLDTARDVPDLAVPDLTFDQWSPDAQIAGRGLLRELREMSPSEDAIPGFRGPDDWYRGER